MDQEDFIKIQHESSVKMDNTFANFYMTQFYDHDSYGDQHLIKRQDLNSTAINNTEELLDRLDQKIDLRTMSLENIKVYARQNFIIDQQINWSQFDKNLRKRKMIMKRLHAKNREYQTKRNEYYIVSDSVEGLDIKQQIQTQIKKKRNRMSAQISRDRKKLKIQQLQVSNKKLKAQTEKMLQENQRIKKQLQQFNRVEQKKIQVSRGKNKFLSLLVMFGIFFLLSVLRQSIKAHSPFKVSGKISKTQQQVVTAEEQSKLIEDGQKIFQDIESQRENILGGRKALKNMLFKLEQIKSQTEDLQIPKELKQQLDIAHKQIS